LSTQSDTAAAESSDAIPSPAAKTGLRATLLISLATSASRVLGLVREQLFAMLLGAGYFADAFVVAFRIPNLLRDLFAEGALSAAFVPTFAQVEKERGADEAHAVANRLIGALLLVVGVLTVLGMVFAGPVVGFFAPGFAAEPGKLELTSRLAVLMMPFLPVVSLAAVMMGMLNARARFRVPALAPALFNVAAILVGLGLKLAGAEPQVAVFGWAVGTLLGGLAQLVIQIPPLRRDGYRLLPSFRGLWRDPALRRIARLMAPATLGLAAVEANIFINTQFASGQPGANAWLNYAFRLMYVPIGVFGVAIATVTTTNLARKAAEKDLAGMKAGLGQGLRHVAFLTIPATVGLVLLAEPIISLVYQHGRFTAADTQATALALAGYSLGLYAYSAVKVAAPAFYALDRPRVPLIGSAAAVATNLTFNLFAFPTLGYIGLAVGISLGAMVNLLIITTVFRRTTRGVSVRSGLFAQLVRVVLAAGVMGLVVWATVRGIDLGAERMGLAVQSLLLRLVRVLCGVGVGALVYAGAAKLLRIGEMEEILSALRRRRRRKAASQVPSPAG